MLILKTKIIVIYTCPSLFLYASKIRQTCSGPAVAVGGCLRATNSSHIGLLSTTVGWLLLNLNIVGQIHPTSNVHQFLFLTLSRCSSLFFFFRLSLFSLFQYCVLKTNYIISIIIQKLRQHDLDVRYLITNSSKDTFFFFFSYFCDLYHKRR